MYMCMSMYMYICKEVKSLLQNLMRIAEAGSKPTLDDAAAEGVLRAWPRVASAPAAGGWPMCEAGGSGARLTHPCLSEG